MTPDQLAAIRARAEAIDLGEPASLISALAVDAHKDRAALLDHVDALAARLAAVRELHRRGEFEDSPGDYYCTHCQTTAGIWPCPTIQAIDSD